MSYTYNVYTGLTRVKSNTKKYIAGAALGLVGALALTFPAIAAPTPGPVGGPGCFGQWRAGSVQFINGHAPGTENTGSTEFSVRAGDNSTINASNRATCDALTP